MAQVVTLHLPVGVEFALGLKGERGIHSKISQNHRAMNQQLFPMQLKETFPHNQHLNRTSWPDTLYHRVFERMNICMQWYVECSCLSSISKNQMFGGLVLHKKLPQEWRGTGENPL